MIGRERWKLVVDRSGPRAPCCRLGEVEELVVVTGVFLGTESIGYHQYNVPRSIVVYFGVLSQE